jgi:hypothetical protein
MSEARQSMSTSPEPEIKRFRRIVTGHARPVGDRGRRHLPACNADYGSAELRGDRRLIDIAQ